MNCDWEDRNSMCQLEARSEITYGEADKLKKTNLCPECTNLLWDMVLPKVRTGLIEWHQVAVPKKNG